MCISDERQSLTKQLFAPFISLTLVPDSYLSSLYLMQFYYTSKMKTVPFTQRPVIQSKPIKDTNSENGRVGRNQIHRLALSFPWCGHLVFVVAGTPRLREFCLLLGTLRGLLRALSLHLLVDSLHHCSRKDWSCCLLRE